MNEIDVIDMETGSNTKARLYIKKELDYRDNEVVNLCCMIDGVEHSVQIRTGSGPKAALD